MSSTRCIVSSRPTTQSPPCYGKRCDRIAFRGLMIFLQADCCRHWNNYYVVDTDASRSGYGVVSAFWKEGDVAAVGRSSSVVVLGSWDHTWPGMRPLRPLVSSGTQTGEWRAGWLTSEEYLARSGWDISRELREVPGRLLSSRDWNPSRRHLGARGASFCQRTASCGSEKFRSRCAPVDVDGQHECLPCLWQIPGS